MNCEFYKCKKTGTKISRLCKEHIWEVKIISNCLMDEIYCNKQFFKLSEGKNYEKVDKEYNKRFGKGCCFKRSIKESIKDGCQKKIKV